MALLIPASSSAAALAVAAVMPTAQHALRVFSRSSSFMSLTAPRPLASNQQQQQSCQVDSDDSISTAFTWTFAPLARELTRTAGGFEHRARWPLTNGSTLLDMHVNNTNASSSSSFNGLSFSSVYARRYSSLPHTSVDAQPTPTQQQHQDFSSAAGAIELPEQPASAAAAVTTPPAGLMAVWFPKAQPRLKGFCRKHVLRKFNQRVVARVARRFTIAIPVLGFYFVSKLMMKDYARVRQELANDNIAVAALFSTALLADAVDLAAQMTIILGLGHANLGGIGLAGAVALLAHADMTSLATAAVSFSCGLGGEALSLSREAQAAEGSSSPQE